MSATAENVTSGDYKVADLSPRRLRAHGDPHGRARDARPHGTSRGVRGQGAAEGRAHRRLPAHDHPDRRADRDAGRARCRDPLVELQHLLHPGPRRRRHRRRGHPRVRVEGRDRGGGRVVHPPDDQGPERLDAEPDPRRRRRPDGHDARGLPRAHGRREGALRGDDDGRAPPRRDGEEGHAQGARDQRQRLGHQEQVRQPLRLPRVAPRRHQAGHRRHGRRQGLRRARLRRRRQGLRAGVPRHGRDRLGHRDRSDQRAAGGDGGVPRRAHGRRGRSGRHRRHRHGQRQRRHPTITSRR